MVQKKLVDLAQDLTLNTEGQSVTLVFMEMQLKDGKIFKIQ